MLVKLNLGKISFKKGDTHCAALNKILSDVCVECLIGPRPRIPIGKKIDETYPRKTEAENDISKPRSAQKVTLFPKREVSKENLRGAKSFLRSREWCVIQ